MLERTFGLFGATPERIGLTAALKRICAGTIDAQENSLANDEARQRYRRELADLVGQ